MMPKTCEARLVSRRNRARRSLGADVKLDRVLVVGAIASGSQVPSLHIRQKLKVTAIDGEPISRLIVAIIAHAHTSGGFMNRQVCTPGRAAWIHRIIGNVTERSTPKVTVW
jgi:hypothetical protein